MANVRLVADQNVVLSPEGLYCAFITSGVQRKEELDFKPDTLTGGVHERYGNCDNSNCHLLQCWSAPMCVREAQAECNVYNLLYFYNFSVISDL